MMGLWHNPNFRNLWVGRTISAVGSQITFIALPLTAVLLLNASAMQMGILTAAVTLPYLLVGLPAGVWVDRLRRRSILITADVCRAVLLVTIPLAALLNLLRIEHLSYCTIRSCGPSQARPPRSSSSAACSTRSWRCSSRANWASRRRRSAWSTPSAAPAG